ncbi:hypothetical protein TKK_0008162 [Trichogramma kaykai]
MHGDESVSTLGVRWQPRSDSFHFAASLSPVKESYTKRGVLSETARLFDPLGWLAPVIVVAKILLQDLWLHGVDWDTPLPRELSDRWLAFRNALPLINTIKVSRWINLLGDTRWHLHEFADASQRAYGAVLYAVIPDTLAIILTAKSKVAPTKVESLPRLELCGALLLARLTRHLLDGLTHQPYDVTLWSDSQVTLAWLQGHPSKWPTFVANGVSQIRTLVPQAQWLHVAFADNPADIASRGTSPLQLAEANLWWKGPHWLPYKKTWPKSSLQAQPNVESLRAHATATTASRAQDNESFITVLSKYSDYEKLLRIIAWIYRWRANSKVKRETRTTGLATVSELNAARIAIFHVMQEDKFKTELDCVRQNRRLPTKSSLLRLVPFMDTSGLLRVGGRLQNSILEYNERHPVILPGNSSLTRCYLEHVHRITLHGGIQLMRSHLARSVWITNGLRMVQGVYHRCVTCTRYQARPRHQRMAPLPEDCVTPTRIFEVSGVDFAGPFALRMSEGPGSKRMKGYICIFVCMLTKAVCIEWERTKEVDKLKYSQPTERNQPSNADDCYFCKTDVRGYNSAKKDSIKYPLVSSVRKAVEKGEQEDVDEYMNVLETLSIESEPEDCKGSGGFKQ